MFRNVCKLTLTFAIGLLILAGCGSEKAIADNVLTSSQNNNTDVVQSENEVADVAEVSPIKRQLLKSADEVQITETEVIFKDDSGRDVITIQKNPQKVAVLYGSHACLWKEAGGDIKIGIGGKGAEALYKDQIGHNFLEDEGVVTIAKSSSAKTWDIEAILAEQPDLIICSTAMNGYSTLSAPAEAANIPVIAITYSGVGDYLKWFKVFCNINSKPELWDSIANKTVDDIAHIIESAPVENTPKVLSILPKTDAVSANLAASDMGVIIEQLHAINVVDDLAEDLSSVRVDINLETMLATNPDMIFVQCIGSEEEARELMDSHFLDNPVWNSLEAVKNNKIYYMPKRLFHNRPNREYNESYKMMFELLYPEIEL
ncbi:ABC transporter substrate-binding protein [Fusibacter ferrireducens]|uniref:ABC transporter substrate-binding protein n=1 Tax=Fusibacter ferrireducens TaxID=2785058 RepID=A0ABR9ZQ77_9FIRM|nr:ABC transporter substrate-binding protein [Fusibacter ferrireducens]MBF4691789.1 ABC transporter substrate-binding protein [Fusibacter ferrireducens]